MNSWPEKSAGLPSHHTHLRGVEGQILAASGGGEGDLNHPHHQAWLAPAPCALRGPLLCCAAGGGAGACSRSPAVCSQPTLPEAIRQ
jgi:hypothetical protein